MPSKVTENNIEKCELFNFKETAKSLIEFGNTDQDMLFKYFDNKNKSRLNKLNTKAGITKDLTTILR